VTSAGRAKREQVRRQAATLFASGMSPVEVAARLEISTKSARVWRRAWVAGGEAALASKGPSGPPSRLSPQQLRQLEQLLQAGPAAAGDSVSLSWSLRGSSRSSANMFVTPR